MGKTKYKWWGYVKAVLRNYPDNVTAAERQAVETALDAAGEYANGESRVKVIELVYFQKTVTLIGAAQMTFYSYDTVQNWQSEFIKSVAKNLKLSF